MNSVCRCRRRVRHSVAAGRVGTPRQVHDEVRLRIAQFGREGGGGLILSPAYDMQDDVPLASIEAFFAACRQRAGRAAKAAYSPHLVVHRLNNIIDIEPRKLDRHRRGYLRARHDEGKMTAEIAIMNKGAIALAADSAVTMQRPGGPKIYNSVNKLFMLSKYQPVGIMVYGQAEFSGVPWETIIKEYRKRLGGKQLPTLGEYVADFLAFLRSKPGLFSDQEQTRYVRRTILGVFSGLRDEIDKKVKALFEGRGKATNPQIRAITRSVITEAWKVLHDAKRLPCFEELTDDEVAEKLKEIVAELQQSVFEKLPLPTDLAAKLRSVATSLFLKDRFTGLVSGVVIAGFGECEHYPSLAPFIVDGFLDGRLRHLPQSQRHITDNSSARIVPFAQSEMVHTFMEGIDPFYHQFLESYLEELFDKLPGEIINALPNVTAKDKTSLGMKLKESCDRLLEDLKERTNSYRRERHVDPVIEAVAILPKDELAAMAESLVNLTSFKRRMSMDAETVGGPIDVAVISKGDGFIWIKRKHYFDPRLNPGFLANYYRDAAKGDEDAQGKASQEGV